MTPHWRSRALGVAAVLVLAGTAGWLLAGTRPAVLADDLRDALLSNPVRLTPLRLIDQHGLTVTESSFVGQWTLLTFGFIHCQDVCPANLAQFGAIKRTLAQQYPKLAQPRYMFVSVDTGRDTPAHLARYLSGFDRSFIGVTGDAAQIKALEQPFATFHRMEQPSAAGDYRVSHSGEMFLLDPAGSVYARFVPPLEPTRVTRQLSSIMALYTRTPRPTAVPSR